MAGFHNVKRLVLLGSSLVAASCVCDGCNPDINARELLGNAEAVVSNEYYKDFGGFSTHGEFFDFQECRVDTTGLKRLVRGPAFAHAPDYRSYRSFYKSKLQNVACITWQKTPLDSTAASLFNPLLRFGNLLDDNHSRRFLQKNYLATPGNFYAYFVGYPAGNNLYVLVPAEGRLFIIRKRG